MNAITTTYATYTARLDAIRKEADQIEQTIIKLEKEWTPDLDDWAFVEALDERLSRLQRAEEACKKVLDKLEGAMSAAEWVEVFTTGRE